MVNVAIIGAGQLGSRHLSSLALSVNDLEIQVVDPFQGSLEVAKSRFEEANPKDNIKSIRYVTSIAELETSIDVAIVATNSDIRRITIETLLGRCSVPYLVLEKALFQRLKDYDEVAELLACKGIKAWVNCPRRMLSFYADVKKDFDTAMPISFQVSGNWAMGCNAIHMIDLFHFISSAEDIRISPHGLSDEVLESKRRNFVEFTGSLFGSSKSGHTFCLTSHEGSPEPEVLHIQNGSASYLIAEVEGRALKATAKGNWKWEEVSFRTEYQSELTRRVVDQLISEGSCPLTPFNESVALHKAMISAFLSHLEKVKGKPCEVCPIT